MKKTKTTPIIHRNQIRTLWKISHLPSKNLKWSTVVLLCRRIVGISNQIMWATNKWFPKMQAEVNLQLTSKTRSHNFWPLQNFPYHSTLCWTIWVVNHNGQPTPQDRLVRNFQHCNGRAINQKYHSGSSHKANNKKQNTHRKWATTTDRISFIHRSLFNLATTYKKNIPTCQEVTSN